jgi:hypothetical protein
MRYGQSTNMVHGFWQYINGLSFRLSSCHSYGAQSEYIQRTDVTFLFPDVSGSFSA